MFVKWYMEECVFGVFLAKSFLGLHGSEFLPKGRQPSPLLNFISFNSGHPHRWARSLCALVWKHWQSPAAWNRWLDFTNFFPIHHPSHSQTYWATRRGTIYSFSARQFFQLHQWLEIWRFNGIDGKSSHFGNLKVEIITHLTLNIRNLH